MVKCKICKSKHNINLKGTFLNNFLCVKCKKKNKTFSSRLNTIETTQAFLKDSNDRIRQEQHLNDSEQLKAIPFNCWIIQERQQEKKFLMQQTNKTFLMEQYKKDLNREMQEEYF